MFKLICIICFLFPFLGYGQVKSIGTPFIRNYPKSEYNAGTQNWGIAQDDFGFMYFANNDGVLRYDGIHWELFKVSQTSAVRSIFIDSKNRIFVGMFNDFGILKQTSSGNLAFESFRSLLPNSDLEFDDVWKIHEMPQGIFFQSFDHLFIYTNDELDVILPQNKFHFSFNVDGRLFIQEPGVGLFEYLGGKFNKLHWGDQFTKMEIWDILSIGDNQFLICTSRNGIYKYEDGNVNKWETPANDLVKEYTLYSATRISDLYYAFGTVTNGIIISNAEGEIVQQISKNEGLQNKTVSSIYSDKSENLWLGLDNGIDYIETNSPVSYLFDHEGLGAGYAARIFKNKLYLGTNQGLFVKPFNEFTNGNENFQLIENTTGQVWTLDIFDNQLICGHKLGTFAVTNDKATQISAEEGGWKFIRLMQNPDLLLGGHYTGLQLLKKIDGEWRFFDNVKGFDESSRYLIQDKNGVVWMSHGGKGIFKILLNNGLDSVSEYTLYTSLDGLPSDEQNIIFQHKNQPIVSTVNGIYEYDNNNDGFIYSEKLNKTFQFKGRLKTLETDTDGNIWFIAQDESGVFRINEDLTYTKITSPLKQLDHKYVNEFEFLYPYNDNNIFLGIDDGFAHYSSKFSKSYSESFKAFITKIEIPYLDSIVIPTGINTNIEYIFPFKKNSFRFHYTAPFYENQNRLQFSFLLENYLDDWSEWTSDSYKDFTNLPEGKYILKIKARNLYDMESSVAEFGFEITPPWHRSSIAWYLYIVLFVIFNFFVVRFVLYRLKVAKRKEAQKLREEMEKKEEEFQRQALIADKEIVKLRNDKLRSEKIHRDKELANQTMNIIQKNKFLMRLNEELQRVQNATEDSVVKTKMALIKNRIKKEIDNQQQHQLFETYFEDVHNEFFTRLKEKYPQLTPNDLKLCAYIRMNITTKEIATLLNISYRGAEISRYRLRKKMELSRDINLSVFLSNI